MATGTYCTVKVLEIERNDDGEYSIVYGKGRHKNDLVYFQLDGGFLRQPDECRSEGKLQVTAEEEVGRAIGHFVSNS